MVNKDFHRLLLNINVTKQWDLEATCQKVHCKTISSLGDKLTVRFDIDNIVCPKVIHSRT